ncbi:10815_t:CDS:1, partial [Gigaspora margarita]
SLRNLRRKETPSNANNRRSEVPNYKDEKRNSIHTTPTQQANGKYLKKDIAKK